MILVRKDQASRPIPDWRTTRSLPPTAMRTLRLKYTWSTVRYTTIICYPSGVRTVQRIFAWSITLTNFQTINCHHSSFFIESRRLDILKYWSSPRKAWVIYGYYYSGWLWLFGCLVVCLSAAVRHRMPQHTFCHLRSQSYHFAIGTGTEPFLLSPCLIISTISPAPSVNRMSTYQTDSCRMLPLDYKNMGIFNKNTVCNEYGHISAYGLEALWNTGYPS